MNPIDLINLCQWDSAQYFLFSGNVFANLIYYSHLLPFVAACALGFFLIINNYKSGAVRSLFVGMMLLGTWLLFDLLLWATEKPEYTMFFWSIINMIEPVIYAAILFFVYYFVKDKPPSFKQVLGIFVLLLPTVVLTPTHFALEAFNLSNCDREAVEGIMVYYGYFVESLFVVWIFTFGLLSFLKEKSGEARKKIALVIFSSLLLLLAFAVGNVIGSFFVNWEIGQYGLLGIPIFVGLLGYLVIRFGAFNIKLIGAQGIVAGLFILVLGLLFIRTIEVVRVVTSITLLFVLLLGYWLIRGVKREIEQREKIELLARELETANGQQVILIHFITHQIKGFVAKSRNIFSLMLDGDYGVLPEPAKEAARTGFESDTKGAQTIAEILNAANIKSGKVSYAMQAFDLKGLIEGVVKDLTPAAEHKGLVLTATLAPVTYTGDKAQLVSAFKNLIDNSIKYTQKGSVAVSLAQTGNTVRFEIVDTGVGITPEDMKGLFSEGGRGKNSQKINVESTGFGLYIVKNIIEAHKGKVWAESQGEGKGAHFVVELPVS